MLFKRIDTNSIPFGLAIAGEDIKKGSAVVVKNTGKGANGLEAFLPASQAEADAVKGFATFRIEEEGLGDKAFEIIKKDSWVVIYTIPRDTMWGTTEVVGTVVAGDKLGVGYTDATDKGKLRALTAGEVTASRKPQFEVFDKTSAGDSYTDAVVNVTVL